MPQSRKNSVLLIALIVAMVAAAVGLRQVSAMVEWAPLFDIGALLGLVGLSLQWDHKTAEAGIPSRN